MLCLHYVTHYKYIKIINIVCSMWNSIINLKNKKIKQTKKLLWLKQIIKKFQFVM